MAFLVPFGIYECGISVDLTVPGVNHFAYGEMGADGYVNHCHPSLLGHYKLHDDRWITNF